MPRSSYDAPVSRLADRRVDPPCRGTDGDLWFAPHPAAIERAKALCGTCPLQESCLAEALERHEPWGVWGGQLFENGVVIAQKRRPGRPRKDAAPLAS